MKRPFLVLLPFLLLAACEGSPTDPDTRPLSGAYEGRLEAFPSGEDWTTVRLTVGTVGNVVTGTLNPKTGPEHPVTGQRTATGFVLDVHNLPQTTPCTVQMHVDEIGAASIRGELSGRCPSTLMSSFRLNRAL
ncbi:MAG TPA: hypothetical protein VF432_22460 [Thermoanaerobaculia bacterium]